MLGAALVAPAAAIAGHSDLRVPPGNTFELGGEQAAPLVVSGRNLGSAGVVILARAVMAPKEIELVRVAPGGLFSHRFAVGEVALIRNGSRCETAHLAVDFTGAPSSLSMTYAGPAHR